MRFDGSTCTMPWRAQLPLSLPATAGPTGCAEACGLVTTSGLGGCSARDLSWQFEPGLAVELEPASAWITCSGFELRFKGAPPFRFVYLGNGRWRGHAPAAVVPDLFSTHQETREESGIRLLDTPSGNAALLHRLKNNLRHIALIVSDSLSQADLCGQVEELMEDETGMEHAWQLIQESRNTWAASLPETGEPEEAMLALEHLVGSCRTGTTVEGPWLYDGEQPLSPEMIASGLEALAAAGSDRVSAVLRTLTTLPRLESGCWPHSLSNSPSSAPAGPVMAQGLLRLNGVRDTHLLSALAETCTRHLRGLIGEWTPDQEALPIWPEADCAFTPEIAGGDLSLFDFPSLLLAEMEACSSLAEDPALFQTERTELRKRIPAQFWSPKRKAFLDRTPDGDQARRLTAGTLLPLLWNDLPREHLRPLAQLPGEEVLKDATGIRQWEPRDRDPAPPPVRLETHHVLLPALDRLREEAGAPLSAALHRGVTPDGDRMPSLLASALRIRLLPYAQRVNPNLERYPHWILWLEKHRAAVVGTAAMLLFITPLAAGLWVASNPKLSPMEEHLTMNQAATAISLQRFEEADDLYTLVLTQARDDSRFARYYFKRGNLRYRMELYADAVADYEAAIDRDPEGLLHQARWNRAQAYRKLGDTPEALAALQGYLDEYGAELPEQRVRAELAIRLLQP